MDPSCTDFAENVWGGGTAMATSAKLRRESLAGQWEEAICKLYGTELAARAPPLSLVGYPG